MVAAHNMNFVLFLLLSAATSHCTIAYVIPPLSVAVPIKYHCGTNKATESFLSCKAPLMLGKCTQSSIPSFRFTVLLLRASKLDESLPFDDDNAPPVPTSAKTNTVNARLLAELESAMEKEGGELVSKAERDSIETSGSEPGKLFKMLSVDGKGLTDEE
eukprot:CAMPEP_0113321028 /NCGR_PEP_ID=MMETSP0010_2-20120614/14647_1 /TAXON_ID=216773 ORGANISM="Corethron hystrix, Strain 308" /NCGR_SAMPLE_ID=MMETSP0010_2 /ASSEMBLY_ACC=CAM_ASM_000155 /LENGTH=158 /DNA_ID=CAMNT_0000179021 /DNA_START=55 /DNA_END=528 /DNA_ORIENTATION=- /assembly_acc=CAM_ASM_000155